ncbi:conserved hypothetical protein [Candidatus Desulfosporosinus infrequens]|uniref:Uncharacterized protein n=1 Tax=Candidatus Desulfosporosinus infrequens TaxID=2043169 RepID=A0A2U3K786_9FIRM|nr:conserved hypothetical protein [Candidatus Desulfosporosinus infrequens]
MHFLKKFFSKDNTPETSDIIPEQTISVSQDHLDSTLQNNSENIQPVPNSINLRSKFLRIQKSSFSEPPETFHENEAWAPEPEFVGLFRKRRINAIE